VPETKRLAETSKYIEDFEIPAGERAAKRALIDGAALV
jgi:hypothetical protein